ncbi:MAG: DNA alkylation repair protein [Marinoscillum sp.]
MEYLDQLEDALRTRANDTIAMQQSAYMRHQFAFFGIKSPVRKELSKPFLSRHQLPDKSGLDHLVRELWVKEEREFQMFGLDLVANYQKQFVQEDIQMLEFMILNKSWWDSVDLAATHFISSYLKMFPELKEQKVNEWLESGNIWLQRTALIFQLKWKDQLNTNLLAHCIHQLNGSSEFFINKAIGWILREYSRTNPQWVQEFVEENPLNTLSKREALRLMK